MCVYIYDLDKYQSHSDVYLRNVRLLGLLEEFVVVEHPFVGVYFSEHMMCPWCSNAEARAQPISHHGPRPYAQLLQQ